MRNITHLKLGGSTVLFFVFVAFFFFGVSKAKADYYPEATALSVNLLEGFSDVAQITAFKATATIPASTAVQVQFSRNGEDFFNSDGVKGGWSDLADGETSIDLRAFDWTTADFYYRARFTTSDPDSAALLSEVEVEYSDTYTPYNPWSSGYYFESSVLSDDLLPGAGTKFNGSEMFGYDVQSLPVGTSVAVQFSCDGENFYDSSGTLWGWDALSLGPHLGDSSSIDLVALEWIGEESFYYRMKFLTDGQNAPVVSEAGLFRKSAVSDPAGLPEGSRATINMSLTDKLTDGLVGMWSFDGPDVNMSTNTAYDRSGQGNNGTISGATPVIGKKGQGMSFDGTDDYVAISGFQFPASDQFSIFKFVKIQTLSAGKPLISQWGGNQNNILVKIDDSDSDEIRVCVASSLTDNCSNYARTADAELSENNWYGIHISYDGSRSSDSDKLKLYVNGAEKTLSFSGNISSVIQNASTADLEIGANSGQYGRFISDEVRIYNRALSPEEVRDLYNLGQTTIKREFNSQ